MEKPKHINPQEIQDAHDKSRQDHLLKKAGKFIQTNLYNNLGSVETRVLLAVTAVSLGVYFFGVTMKPNVSSNDRGTEIKIGEETPPGSIVVERYADWELNGVDVCYGESKESIKPYKIMNHYNPNTSEPSKSLTVKVYANLNEAESAAKKEYDSLKKWTWLGDKPHNKKLSKDPSYCDRYQNDQYRQ
jgi:hypothetical protein